MTYGSIIVCSIITLIILVVFGAVGFATSDTKGLILGIIIGVIVSAIMWFIVSWYYNNTEDGKRARKTQDSNFNGGITRKVRVYDMDGDLIEEYHGKFDVECTSERIMFDDENNQRHIIYYKSGTVIVDEVKDD